MQPQINIQPAFAVPFGSTRLENAAELNQALKALFLTREQDGKKYRNPNQNSVVSDELFESHFDLFKWPEECIGTLRDFMTDGVLETIGMLNQYKRSRVAEFDVYADAWFHITRKHGYFTNHNHPMATWSAVYCVDDGEAEGESLDESGVTRFFHPNSAASMYMDPGILNMTQGPFGFSHRCYKLKAGEMVIFPSWVYHEVSPYKGTGTRITVAVNYWFKHPLMDPQAGPQVRAGRRD